MATRPVALPVCRRKLSLARRNQRGSVLLIVLITLVFATVAMFVFIERASNDLLVEKRSSDAANLRLEAYSALETTLAVLEDFRQVNGVLRSPSEGWGNPLEFSGYLPPEGRTVEVAFEDESGKYSLPNVTQATLPLSKDNVIFAVQATGAQGHRSLAVVPVPER